MAIGKPLSVSGRFIVDADGNRVKLTGVNWAGAHQDAMTPGGLNYRHRDEIADQVASWGFNSVRFPFALPTLTSADPVDPDGLAANQDLIGATPWQVYTACVRAMTRAGLMVIPNCHLLYPGWCCSDSDSNGLWWNAVSAEAAFTSGWQTVAAEFAGDRLVIGYDLKNEPRPASISGTEHKPSWGDGNAETDFCQLYSGTATSIQAADPGALFFCEGLSYASDLTGARDKLVTPASGDCVVYSMHDYSWFHAAGQSADAYADAMDAKGGFLMSQGIAPLWVGEFGTGNDSLAAVGASTVIGASSGSDARQGEWFGNFQAWAAQTDLDWCYWQLDGTMCQGTTPGTGQLQWALGDRATYGLFAQDWRGPSNPALLAALQALQPAVLGPGISTG